jgi:hypothetical protein
MDIKKELKIELSGTDAEKIITDYISEKMKEQGYSLTYNQSEEGPWPDTFWRGEEAP